MKVHLTDLNASRKDSTKRDADACHPWAGSDLHPRHWGQQSPWLTLPKGRNESDFSQTLNTVVDSLHAGHLITRLHGCQNGVGDVRVTSLHHFDGVCPAMFYLGQVELA